MSTTETDTEPELEPEPQPIPKSEIMKICNSKQDPTTQGSQLLRTVYRVKDPKRSIKFYNCLGMTLLDAVDIPSLKTSIYTMGYVDSGSEKVPSVDDEPARNIWAMSRPSTLELSYHWGSESNPAFHYDLGSGYSHIAIMVPNVRQVTERLQNLGVIFSKTPDETPEGTMKGYTIFVDPDGYVIAMHDRQAVHDYFVPQVLQQSSSSESE